MKDDFNLSQKGNQMRIENCIEANIAVLELLRQHSSIDISHRVAFDLAKIGGFASIEIDQEKLNSLIQSVQAMSGDELREFRKDLASKERTDPDQYPVLASH